MLRVDNFAAFGDLAEQSPCPSATHASLSLAVVRFPYQSGPRAFSDAGALSLPYLQVVILTLLVLVINRNFHLQL